MILETFSLRLDWAVDGSALLAVNSLQPPSHTAAILPREKWEAPLYAVGHRGAVTAVGFNPVLFSSDKADDTEGPNLCYALGAQVFSASFSSTCNIFESFLMSIKSLQEVWKKQADF